MPVKQRPRKTNTTTPTTYKYKKHIKELNSCNIISNFFLYHLFFWYFSTVYAWTLIAPFVFSKWGGVPFAHT